MNESKDEWVLGFYTTFAGDMKAPLWRIRTYRGMNVLYIILYIMCIFYIAFTRK